MIDLDTAHPSEIMDRIKELEKSMESKHLQVCMLILRGELQHDAWKAVYKRATINSAAVNCSRMLNDAKSHGSEYLELMRWKFGANAAEQLGIDKLTIIKRLDDISLRCMQAEPVLDNDGDPTGEYTFNAAGATKASELIGKEIGMFVDRKQVTSTRKITTIKRVIVYPKDRQPEKQPSE